MAELADEPIVVQAAYRYLDTKGVILWRDWIISDPQRKLEAARALAADFEGVQKVLTSNDFSPI